MPKATFTSWMISSSLVIGCPTGGSRFAYTLAGQDGTPLLIAARAALANPAGVAPKTPLCDVAPPRSARSEVHVVQATGVFRRAADRQPAPRQLPRRHHEIRGAAGDARLHLLRRRHARDHGLAGSGGADPQHA